MIRISLILAFGLISNVMLGQNQRASDQKMGPTLRLETGIYYPLGDFEKYIDPSPAFNIIAGIPLSDAWRLDPGLQLFIPQSRKPLTVNGDDGPKSGRINSLSGHLGASINRILNLSPKILMEPRMGIGFSFLQTDAEKENVPKESNDKFYGSETIYLQGGLGIKFFAFRYSYIGLEFNYYFTPYNLFGKRFISSIGNQAISLGISYGL
ncbi:MAG: hypothetical protein WBG46_08805 [Nonlabens sp.]